MKPIVVNARKQLKLTSSPAQTKCDYSRKWATLTTTIQRALNVLPHKRHCACKPYGCNNELCGSTNEWDEFRVFETSKCFTKRDTLKERSAIFRTIFRAVFMKDSVLIRDLSNWSS